MGGGSATSHPLLLTGTVVLSVWAIANGMAGFAFLALREWAWWYGTIVLTAIIVAGLVASLWRGFEPRALVLPIMFVVMLALALSTRSQFRDAKAAG